MPYVPESSQNALKVFLTRIDSWSVRYSLDKAFDAFIDYFKSQGVISVNYAENENQETINQNSNDSRIDHISQCPTQITNQKTNTNIEDKTIN